MATPTEVHRQGFPSAPDLRSLRLRLKELKFELDALTNAERWHYHAYDYAFLRVRHGLDNRRYPLDEDGKWFDEGLVQAAERLPLKRQVQIHGERLANGDPTPEMLAFMRCCARQAEANAAIYAQR